MTPLPLPPSPASGRPGGFTLLEALLALFIFSTAVISLVEAINVTGRTVIIARREREIQSRLESLLLEATRSPEYLNKARSNQAEETKVQEGDVTFTIRTAPIELENKEGQVLQDLYSVAIPARWVEGREEQSAFAETWI